MLFLLLRWLFQHIPPHIPKTKSSRKREYLAYAAARAHSQVGGDGLGICKRVGIQPQTLDKISRTSLWQEALTFYNIKGENREIRNELYFERLNAFKENRKPVININPQWIGDLKKAKRIWTELFKNDVPHTEDAILHPDIRDNEGVSHE